jgi:hypothetical protein
MKGNKQDVQRRLLDINPKAFYTPCGSHNINLVLCDMANSCTKTVYFFLEWYNIYIHYFLLQQKDGIFKKKKNYRNSLLSRYHKHVGKVVLKVLKL